MRRRAMLIFMHVIIPVMAGAVFYYLFCPDALFVSLADRLWKSGSHVRTDMSSPFVKLVRNYLPDFVWAYAFMALVQILFEADFDRKRLFLIIAVFETFLELIQMCPSISGTFDIFDIAAEIIANILVIYFLSRRKYTK